MHVRVFVLLVAMTTMVVGFMTNSHPLKSTTKKPITQVTGILGEKASLPCDIQPPTAQDKVDMVLWLTEANGIPIYSYDVRRRPVNQPKLMSSRSGFSTRASFITTTTPARLFLEVLSTADSGVYRCRVDFQDAPSRNLRVNLTVIIPPQRLTIVDAKTRGESRLLQPYNEGDTIDLLCEVSGGIPRPRLIWYLENTIIDESYEQRDDGINSNTLTFPRLGRQHHNARFFCEASNTNKVPPIRKLFILKVNSKPLSVQIVKKAGILSAGHNYYVECISAGSRPKAQITWWKNSKPLTKNVKNFSRSNYTRSVVQLVPDVQDHEKKLVCRAQNPQLRDSTIEDTWILHVQYLPIVSLKMSSNENSFHIAEEDDVYFECSAHSNPVPSKISWYKQGIEISPDESAGVLINKHILKLQNVYRNASGEYSCTAQNDEGIGTSNPVDLQVRYPPVCISSDNGQVFLVQNHTVELVCEVESTLPPVLFIWSFNNSKINVDINSNYYKSEGSTSIYMYTPITEEDFGVVSCYAISFAGQQDVPCQFTVMAAAVPSSLENCSVVNQSITALHVACQEGFDGGLIQEFHMEVLELPTMAVLSNVTSNTSVLKVTSLPTRPQAHYLLNLYASNAKGRGDISTLYIVISPDSNNESFSPVVISPMLGSIVAIGALLAISIGAVLVAGYCRHVTSGHRPTNLESLPGLDDTYEAPPKIDYNSQSELKLDPDDNADFISIRYGKKEEELKSCVDRDSLKIYSIRGFHTSPSNDNTSVVDRGVTARSTDIAASRDPDVCESYF